MKIGEAWLEISANIAKYSQNISTAKKQFIDFSDTVSKEAREMKVGAGEIIAAVGGIAGIIAPMVIAAKKSMEYAESLEKMSTITGMATDKLGGLIYATEKYEGSAQSLQMGLIFLSRAINGAMSGSEGAQKKFRDLGIEFEDINGKARPVGDVFADLVKRISSIDNASVASGKAMQFLGRGGFQLMGVMRAGSEEISRLSAEAKGLGLALEKDVVGALDDTGDALAQVTKGWTGLAASITKIFSPAMIFVLNMVKDVIALLVKVPEPIKAFGVVLALAAAGVASFGVSLAALGLGFPKMVEGFNLFMIALTKVGPLLWGTTTAVGLLKAALGPYTGLLAILIAVIAYMDKVKANFEGFTADMLKNAAKMQAGAKQLNIDLKSLTALSEKGLGAKEITFTTTEGAVKTTVDKAIEMLKKYPLQAQVDWELKFNYEELQNQVDATEKNEQAKYDAMVEGGKISLSQQIKHYEDMLKEVEKSGKKETEEYWKLKGKIWAMRKEQTKQIAEEAEKQREAEVNAAERLYSWQEKHDEAKKKARKDMALEIIRITEGEEEAQIESARREYQERMKLGVDQLANEALLAADIAEINKKATDKAQKELEKQADNKWDSIKDDKKMNANQKIEFLANLRDQFDKGTDLWKKYDDKIKAIQESQQISLKQSAAEFVTQSAQVIASWVTGFLRGGMTIKQALDGIWKGIVDAFFQAVEQMIAKWLAFKLLTMLGLPVGLAKGGVYSGNETIRAAAKGFSGTGNILMGENGPEVVTTGPQLARLTPRDYVVPIEKYSALMKGQYGVGNVVEGAMSVPSASDNVAIAQSGRGGEVRMTVNMQGAMLSVNDRNVAAQFQKRVLDPAVKQINKGRVSGR